MQLLCVVEAYRSFFAYESLMSKSRLKVSSSREEKRCAVKTLREAETSTGMWKALRRTTSMPASVKLQNLKSVSQSDIVNLRTDLGPVS